MKRIVILIFFLLFTNVYATELPVDVLTMDIKSIQEYHDDGIFTYDELVSFYIDRINAYNEQYNSIISINEDAINDAISLEKQYQEKGLLSELMGIPIILKDNIDYVKLPTTVGTKALKDNYPKSNSEVVEKLINAGAIILGKSNMSEFAFSANNSKSSYGHTKNAYDTNYSPYGSSGGSASSVAAGFAPISLGTDTNASVRTPASANNVVGLRPSCDAVSDVGVVNYDSARDVVGPIGRYVSDVRLLYDIIKKNDDFENKEIKKIGVLKSFMKENDTYDGILNLMEDAIKILSKKYEIVYIDDFYNSYYDNLVRNSYTGRLMCYDFNQYIKNTNSKIKSFQELISHGGYIQPISGYAKYCDSNYKETTSFKNTVNKKEEYRKYVDSYFSKYDVDVLIYPTTRNKLLKIKETDVVPLKTNSYKIAPNICYPSMNISIGLKDNLPYGMEILSKKEDLNSIFEVASMYELETNHYVVPNIAPSLYKIDENVTKLVSYYRKYRSMKYTNVRKKTKEFFKNYNKITNKSEESKKLLKLYEKEKRNILKFDLDYRHLDYSIAYIFSYFALFILLITVLEKKFKKKISKKGILYLFIAYVLTIIILIIR